MVTVFSDRVKETTATTGTGTVSLAGAATQFQSFVAGIGNGNRCDYCLLSGNGSDWEVGSGTVTSGSPSTLSRDVIFASSNSGSAISLVGTSTVFCTNSAKQIAGSPFSPGFVAGNWYTRPTSAALALNIPFAANHLQAVPFFVPKETVFSQMMVYVDGTVANSHIELGVYSNSEGAPAALEYDAGTVLGNTTGQKIISGLTLRLSAGWHWLTGASDNAVGIIGSAGTDSGLGGSIGGFLAISGANNPVQGAIAAWTFSAGNLPATFTAGGSLGWYSTSAPLPFIGL